jgi:hypothetical protein
LLVKEQKEYYLLRKIVRGENEMGLHTVLKKQRKVLTYVFFN